MPEWSAANGTVRPTEYLPAVELPVPATEHGLDGLLPPATTTADARLPTADACLPTADADAPDAPNAR